MSNTKHFYLKNKKGNPVGCVAWFRDGNVISFSLSVCAKNDTFRKSLGRKIATDRLFKKHINSFLIHDISFNKIMKEIMCVIAYRDSSKFPQQAIDSARLWLDDVIKTR